VVTEKVADAKNAGKHCDVTTPLFGKKNPRGAQQVNTNFFIILKNVYISKNEKDVRFGCFFFSAHD
jgi:hypothetical protein